MQRDDIEAAIRGAFVGVRLGSGVSLRQAEYIDQHYNDYIQADFEALSDSEVTDDWTRVPEEELRRNNIGHLDTDGLRYYLPALLLWLLDNYNPTEQRADDEQADMTVIGTIMAVAPGKEFRDRLPQTFDSFSLEQKAAIASYLEALSRLVNLDHEDAARVARSLDQYWRRSLPGSG